MPVTTTTKFARKGISQKKPTEKKSHPHKNKKKNHQNAPFATINLGGFLDPFHRIINLGGFLDPFHHKATQLIQVLFCTLFDLILILNLHTIPNLGGFLHPIPPHK